MVDTDFRKRFEVDAFLQDKEVVEDKATGTLTMKDRAPKLTGDDVKKIGELDIVGYDSAGNPIEIEPSMLPDWVTSEIDGFDFDDGGNFEMGQAFN